MSDASDLRAKAEQLKAAVSVPTIIAETIQLKRDGKTWTATCPFHAERRPSFHVFQDHYHCFGCGAHGDVFDWLEKQRGLSFRGAIDYLSDGRQQQQQQQPRPAPVSLVERAPDDMILRAPRDRPGALGRSYRPTGHPGRAIPWCSWRPTSGC
jgi:DNA primase